MPHKLGQKQDKPLDRISADFSERTGTLTTVSLNIKTLEDALRVSRVDLKIWEVERYVINSWEVTMGGEKTGTDRAETFTNYQVKAWLKRRIPAVLEIAIENLLAKMGAKSSSQSRLQPPKNPDGRFMLEISLFDAHFGLLAWRRETGDDNDLKSAEASFEQATDDLLIKTIGCRPELILFPFGNDFFHINNPEGVTPMAHNILDVDGRLPKVIEAGQRAVIRAIERCLKTAPVRIVFIPGNHDPQTGYFMCLVLKAWFRNNPNVEVDVEPPPRKYVHYGCNLIGFTHGNEEKHHDLPNIMAGEQRAIWGRVKHCEFHVGHYHKEKETRYSTGDTFNGVSVRVLPSISGTDAWHFKKGYVKGKRQAQAFLWDHDHGLVATYYSENLRTK